MKSLRGRGGTGRRHPRVILEVLLSLAHACSSLPEDKAWCLSCQNGVHERQGLLSHDKDARYATQVGSGIKQACPHFLGTRMHGVPLRGQQRMAQGSACKGNDTLEVLETLLGLPSAFEMSN